jgi:hypothetical protein
VADNTIDVARGETQQADATIITDPDTFGAVLGGGKSLAAAQRAAEMTIEGDQVAAERFVQLFPTPAPSTAEGSG